MLAIFQKVFLTTHGHICLILFPECFFIEMIITTEISEAGLLGACVCVCVCVCVLNHFIFWGGGGHLLSTQCQKLGVF
jgi:multisubunit Na+/H+ antiporter MnhG subunit